MISKCAAALLLLHVMISVVSADDNAQSKQISPNQLQDQRNDQQQLKRSVGEETYETVPAHEDHLGYGVAVQSYPAYAGYGGNAYTTGAEGGYSIEGGIPLGEQLVSQHTEVHRDVPVPIYKTVAVPVPQPVPVPVPQPVAVEVPHPYAVRVPYAVPIIKTITVAKPYPVDRPYPVTVEKKVPVYKPYPVHVPVYKIKHIYHHEPKYYFPKSW